MKTLSGNWSRFFDVAFIIGSLLIVAAFFFVTQDGNSTKSVTRLGSAIVNRHFFNARLANANIYAYRYGKYCGKGVYVPSGDKYRFGCHVTVRLLVKKQPTPIPQPIPKPIPTPTPVVGPSFTCTDDRTCAADFLNILNQERSTHNLSPLTIDWNMSFGSGTCIGAKGHSQHMSDTGQLAHDQFPADVCGTYSTAGENIGYSTSSDPFTSFQQINGQMLAEPYSPTLCQTQNNHHCNILSPFYSRIGIGFVSNNNRVYLTEDFKG